MEEYIQVITTLEKKEDAEMIAREMVEKRWAACAQVVGPITSTYRWEGKVEVSVEWLCQMKTRRDLYAGLEETVKGIHPYEVPEIIATPIVDGNAEYLSWVGSEVRT